MSTGSLIRLAREAAGLTQTELADASGIPQPALSRWELDRVEPTRSSLVQLSTALGVTPEFFGLFDGLVGANAVAAHARKRATAKVSVWRWLEARINLHRIRLNRLASLVDVRPALSIQPVDTGTAPAEAARLVRMQWRMPLGPVYPLVSWLEAAGVIVLYEDFGTDKIVGLSQWESLHPIMLINSRAPVDRIRWTLAHELGHLVLHAEPDPELEREADEFAAEFLMPAVEIKHQLHRPTLNSLLAIKPYWMVSVQALLMHARRLERIDDERLRSLYKQLTSRGWRKREPGSDELPAEQPKLVDDLVAAARRTGRRDHEIAEAIYLSDDSDRHLYFGTTHGHLRAI